MLDSPLAQFILTVIVAPIVVYPVAAILTPPDLFTQLLAAGVLMVIALPVAYFFSYQGGYESILGH